LILVEIILLSGLLLAAIEVGRSNYDMPITVRDLREVPGCTLPCWNGLTPGETSIAHANRVLLDSGYTTEGLSATMRLDYTSASPLDCHIQLYTLGGNLTRIRLHQCLPAQLGDMMRLLGTPDGVMADRFAIAFRDGTVLVYAQRIICERRFTPGTFIGHIDLLSESQAVWSIYDWRGFIDLRNYMPRSNSTVQC
jgi:hypothetical protein